MPKIKDETNSPKIVKKKYNLRRKKNKSLQKKCGKDSDSDSSSDYDPKEDKMEDMNPREIQRFIQKIFPSKSGKKRLEQLDKLDKLVNKYEETTKHDEDEEDNDEDKEDEDEDEEGDEDTDFEETIIYNDDGFPDCEDEELDPEMKEMLNNNMKFNIVFTVGDMNGLADSCNSIMRRPGYDLDDEEFDFYEEDTDNESEEEVCEDEEEEEEDDDEEEEEEEKKSSNKKKKSTNKKNTKKLEDKNMDDITEEEWMELARKQEKEMKEKGLYYSTKYKKNDKILFKKKGWKQFKKGIVTKVNHNKVRKKVSYTIKLDEKVTKKRIYNKVLSNRLKPNEEEENILDDLEELIKLKKGKGKEAMKKKFDELCKAEEKKQEKKNKLKEKKEKEKNFIKLRKLMRERNSNNDFKYFKDMNIDSQKKILTKLQAVNDFSKVEKPYRISLLESEIPVEFKANALKKINMLEYMDPGSGEYYKIKNWVDTFMRIPFGKHKNLPVSMEDGPEKCQEFMSNAKKTLDSAVYGLEDAKMQILQMVGQWISNPQSLGTAIAVKGPPGTGKTTLIKEGVSKILNRPFAFLALGGATDSSYLEGHSYTYEGSIWGKIVDILLNCKCMNPVIYFDELDKISDTPKGEEIVGILTHLTDTTQNDKFHDKYFSNIDFNLSRAMFIFSYNDESKVNPILKDRMYRINTGGYKNDQKCVIANKYLIPRIEKNINFKSNEIIIPDETKIYICDKLTDKEQGVRNFKRCLEIIYTKLNLYRLMKEGSTLFNNEEIIKVEFPFTVTKNIVDKLIKTGENNSPPFGMYI